MAPGLHLDLRQSQSLVMTPQLQQAIKLLALSNLELDAYLAKEVESNPLLETQAPEDNTPEDTLGSVSAPEEGIIAASLEKQSADSRADMTVGIDAVMLGKSPDPGQTDPRQIASDFDDNSFQRDSSSGSSGSLDSGSSGDFDFDTIASPPPSLREHLVAQAGEVFDQDALLIAEQLIDSIDETGYLRGDLADIAARLAVALPEVERILQQIQRFDPSGVAARNLAECLAIQAREADRYDPAMARMLAHLDLVAKSALPRLRRICGVDNEDLTDMLGEIRSYDPRPGLHFAGLRAESLAESLVPDLFVSQTKNGWAIAINTATLPRLLVNRRYHAELVRGTTSKNRTWLAEQLTNADWLVRALDQRQRTIVKVGQEIVRQQEAFFLHGVMELRPLTLRQIAEAVEMHESTISRVTSNKYLSCAHGLFALKYFFSRAIASSGIGDDGAVSAKVIKEHIRKLIKNEQPKEILSDNAITALLAKEGYEIARRTVVKYREAMGLGSSVARRRQKKLAEVHKIR